ncbi:M56 family metallopeptidase [Desulfosporosinus sp. FKA]|uniref:M56 family metallopeptidase n=1 Tax=Desulfosporosinus sp. FKA TaxID=1969834 RepID=UPI000B499251|nr:M56 family metallopeptidase [Desulfosporosinus sp. FKA]
MPIAELFHLLVTLSLSGSIMALGLLFIKFLFRQKLNANVHYLLWFVLVLRLIVPFSPQSSLSILNYIPRSTSTSNLSQTFRQTIHTLAPPLNENNSLPKSSLAIPLTSDNNVNSTTSSPGKTAAAISLPAYLWLTGAALIFIYIFMVNGSLLAKIKKLPACENQELLNILKECKTRLKITSKVPVVYDTSFKSPALFGWRKPKIIISQHIIDKLSPKELNFVFLHELSHLKRRDLFVNTFVTLLQIVYWFNPLIWYALHQMKRDCEIACDATALAAIRPEEHKKYAQTIIELIQLLSEPFWIPGTIGFVNKFNTRRIIMISSFRKSSLKWTVAALAMTLIVGCSSLTTPLKPTENTQNQNAASSTNNQQNTSTETQTSTPTPSTSTPSASSQTTPSLNADSSSKTLLLNMMQLARQGKILNSDFPVKTTTIEDIEKALGPADSTNYVGAAKGRYATFSSHKLVFGINKGEQIFEARSFDSRLSSLSLNGVKAVLGTPAYDTNYNNQEIIGYTANSDFKIEMVFPQPTASNPNPKMDHYSVLYPRGTVNYMADDPGRQW